jgi:hypothetical protein
VEHRAPCFATLGPEADAAQPRAAFSLSFDKKNEMKYLCLRHHREHHQFIKREGDSCNFNSEL